jgi:hypothetical protein
MDHRNFDIMAAAHRLMDVNEPYMLLSGYRSPRPTPCCGRGRAGVAKNSLHMKGQAADLRLKSRSVGQMAKAAAGLFGGWRRQLFAVELRPHGLRPGPQLGRLTGLGIVMGAFGRLFRRVSRRAPFFMQRPGRAIVSRSPASSVLPVEREAPAPSDRAAAKAHRDHEFFRTVRPGWPAA